MSSPRSLGGTYTPAGTSLVLHRVGYGAMQLVGPVAFGPPPDREAALAVVREAVRIGVDHIDTSDFYGPHIANELLREALHPYPKSLTLVTKVGARRGADKSWPTALSRDELISAVHDNLDHLGVDVLDVVNLRVGGPFGPDDTSIAEPLSVLAELRDRGLVRHLGLSNVSPAQFDEARGIAEIVCVQNHYNLAHRGDDPFVDRLAALGVAWVPFFPLGGFRPLASPVLDAAAAALGATPRQVALAWLLQRSPNVLLIAGTSSVAHLHDNLAAGDLVLPAAIVAELDTVAVQSESGGRTARS